MALERTEQERGRPFLLGTGALVLVVITALVSYGMSSGRTHTRVVVRTVPVPAKSASQALNCLPGAAPGSCNIDEAAEAKIPDKQLDPATRAQLAEQLVAARTAALKYPTVADAEKAGMILAGKFSPETGAHFIDIRYASGVNFDPSHPGSYIYDGTDPTSKIVGLMYLSLNLSAPPEGFAGPNDHWHRHTNTCVIFGNPIRIPFPADSSVTASQCQKVHGSFMRETVWMVHAWVVPGWESPLGVFSHNNPDLLCADGTSKTDAVGFCQGT